jgi:hypothetical protein
MAIVGRSAQSKFFSRMTLSHKVKVIAIKT